MGWNFTLLTLTACSSVIVLYWLCRWRRHPKKASMSTVLFFPDKETSKLLSSSRRSGRSSKQVLDESSLSILMETLQNTRYCLDVCMFTMACRQLGDVLIKAHQEGLIVRVITDKEQSGASGSQIESLREAGIQVRNDNTSYFMHHKFVLIDGKTLINGSLNWTLQGVCGNQENVIITNSVELVEPFVKQFKHLWALYDPGEIG